MFHIWLLLVTHYTSGQITPDIVGVVEHETLELNCSSNTGDLEWILPNNRSAKDDDRIRLYTRMSNQGTFKIANIFELSLLNRTDSGEYTCVKSDHETEITSKRVFVFGNAEYPIKPNLFAEYIGALVCLVCTMFDDDYLNKTSLFDFYWISPPNADFLVHRQNSSLSVILVSKLEGLYTCVRCNKINKLETRNSFNMNRVQVPGDNVLKDAIIAPNEELYMKCFVNDGYTFSKWFYRECAWNMSHSFPRNEDCSNWTDIGGLHCFFRDFFPKHPGQLKYEAISEQGEILATTGNVFIQDRPSHLVIETNPRDVFSGNTTEIKCFASMYIFNGTIEWYYNDVEINTKEIQVRSGKLFWQNTKYMYGRIIKIENIRIQDAGKYQCVAHLVGHGTREEYLRLVVFDVPRIVISTQKTTVFDTEDREVDINTSMELKCETSGNPDPEITWFKNGKPPTPSMIMHGSFLFIKRFIEEDRGTYECRAENEFGNATKLFNVKIKPSSDKNPINPYALISTLILVCMSLASFVFYRREHKKRLSLEQSGISYFLDGNEQQIDKDLSITEQGDLLPYDTRYDFLSKNLFLGKYLGSGAFGEVFQAEAVGILKTEPNSIVAVKRVKNPTNSEDIKSLISELKIMIYLGKHLNVLNLMGVVHENLNERELLVITEFCPFGNLRDFVRGNRTAFVDQIPSMSENLNSIEYNNSITNNRGMDPQQTSNETESKVVTTRDLVCWSFQVAQGMHFLARKGVLHGDLAARNILLANDNIVKICDFGFSRTLRFDEDYLKNSDMAMPLKWMAIESIAEKTFNSSTDVWAFGVMMWELFTLGEEPYKHISPFELLATLRSGTRLDQPRYSPVAIYTIMTECWKVSPSDRPRFADIGDRLSEMMPNQLLEDFKDRSAEYVKLLATFDEKSIRTNDEVTNPDYRAPNNPIEHMEMLPINQGI